MSTNTNTDLTEEDAADLQFPKEKETSDEMQSFLNINVGTKCSNCLNDLSVVYIMCEECDLNICSMCFSNGVEFSNHKNDHNYRVFNDQFILFENSTWTAREELKLLNGLINLGNWDSISKTFPNRSLKDIKEHYEYFYIHGKGSNLLPKFPQICRGSFIEPVIPYRVKMSNVLDPPRTYENTFTNHSLAGYNAARSDFELEYDANAEDLLCNLELPNVKHPFYDTIVNLQCSIINIYNNRLRERMRRKKVIRKHGLLMLRKITSWLHRYDVTITQNVCEEMCRFMQFCCGDEFEYIMEGLHRAGELKLQIARLCDLRRKGITTLSGASLYMNLKPIQDDQQRDYKKFQNNPYFKWQNKNITIPSKRRNVFTPLDVVGMPGYEKLDLKEKDLCKNIRLVPISYIEFKNILVQENNKSGYLKLLTARRLLKIDVNKTRRLYDFLVQEGYVNKPNN